MAAAVVATLATATAMDPDAGPDGPYTAQEAAGRAQRQSGPNDANEPSRNRMASVPRAAKLGVVGAAGLWVSQNAVGLLDPHEPHMRLLVRCS